VPNATLKLGTSGIPRTFVKLSVGPVDGEMLFTKWPPESPERTSAVKSCESKVGAALVERFTVNAVPV